MPFKFSVIRTNSKKNILKMHKYYEIRQIYFLPLQYQPKWTQKNKGDRSGKNKIQRYGISGLICFHFSDDDSGAYGKGN